MLVHKDADHLPPNEGVPCTCLGDGHQIRKRRVVQMAS
jgi:hypothetical protein